MHLIKHDNPLLHRPSLSVMDEQLENNGQRLKPILQELIRTMKQHQALGLSACQIGIDLAVFCMETNGRIRACANPQIIAASVAMDIQDEGCLSYPGLRLAVRRPEAVAVRYVDADGHEVTEQLEGLDARVWLHEYDHTQGICFTNRVSRLCLDIARRKQAKQEKRMKR